MTNEESAPVLMGQSKICMWRLPISDKMFCMPYLHNYLEPFEVKDYGNSLKCLIKISRNQKKRVGDSLFGKSINYKMLKKGAWDSM